MARVDVEFHGVSGSAVSASRAARDGIDGVGKAARTNSGHVAGLGRSAKDTERELGRLTRGALSGSGVMKGFGRSVAFASGTFLGAAGFISLIRQSVGEAGNLTTEIARSRSEFGKSARGVLDWSKTTASGLGIARSDALKFANTFGQIFAPLQLGQKQTMSMSKSLVNLAGDLAAVNNTTSDRTFDALTSGLTGRARALREFGILISEDRVKAEALSLGLVRAAVDQGKVADAQRRVAIATAELAHARSRYGENTTQVASAEGRLQSAERTLHASLAGHVPTLTAAQHALATYNIVMEQSGRVHREAAKRSGDLTQQEAKLRAELKEQEGELGRALIPTILQVVKQSAAWLGQSRNQARVQRDVRAAVADAKTVLAATWPIVKTFAHFAGEAARQLGGTKEAVRLLVAVLVAKKIRDFSSALLGIGSSAETAGGKVGVLRGALTNLMKLGVITVAIEVLIHRKEIGDFLGIGTDPTGPTPHIPGGGVAPNATEAKSVNGIIKEMASAKWGSMSTAQQNAFKAKLAKKYGLTRVEDAIYWWGQGYHAPGSTGSVPAMQGGNQIPSNVRRGEAAAIGAIGTPYQWGGGSESGPSYGSPAHGTHNLGYDCSGLAIYVLAQAGIHGLPRTSEQLFTRGKPVDGRHLQPLDLVFYDSIHPHHVAVYMGNGRIIVAPHTGARVKWDTVGGPGRPVGYRRYTKSISGAGASTTPTPTPTTSAVPPPVVSTPTGGLTVGTTPRKGPHGVTQATVIGIRASINETIQGQVKELTDAGVQLDEVDRNAIGHLEVLRKHLRAGMSAKDLAETRANIKHWGKVLKDEVQKQLKEAQQAAEDEQARMDRQFRDVTEAAVLRPFDKETQAHIAAFEKDTELALRGMRKSFEAQMSAFDEETRRGLEARAAPGETGDEAALRQFQEQRQAESDAKAMAAAQASGDVEQIRQLELDRQERALELAARQSRDAANKAAEESQRNYQQQRDTQRAALEEQEGDREQAYQDDRAKTLAQYQEMRDDQRTHLQDDLDDWSRWLSEKRKTWVEFLTYLSTHGFVVPSDWFKNTDDDVEVRKLFDAGVRLNTTLTGPQHFALGGRVPGRYLGREDTVMARVTPGERVLDREFNARLEEAVFGGRAGGTTVVLQNPTFVGAPTRDAARAWAPAIADELDRQIGYRNGVA